MFNFNQQTEHFDSRDEHQHEHDETIKKLDAKLYAYFDSPNGDIVTEQKNVQDFIAKLKLKYPNYKEYRLWHLLAGSSPTNEKPLFDFPGDDSVEKFIENLPAGGEIDTTLHA